MANRLDQRLETRNGDELPGTFKESRDEKIVNAFYDVLDVNKDLRSLVEGLHRMLIGLEGYLRSDAEKWVELRRLRKKEKLWAKRDARERRKRLARGK